jgi:type III pantothenate kinase
MLLAADVGNTDICFGLFQGAALKNLWRVESTTPRTADEYAVILGELMRLEGRRFDEIEDVIVGSVVPRVTRMLRWMTEKYTGRPALVVRGDSEHGLPMEVDDPSEVGPDRVLNAIAALDEHDAPIVVVDFGSATTFDVVKKNGAFGGGLIFPGIHTGLAALAAKAARLGSVEIAEPPKAVGTNTVHAMQSGLYWGEVARIDGLLERVEAEIGKATVLATGGLASLIAAGSKRLQLVREDLTLQGLRIVHDRLRAEPAVFELTADLELTGRTKKKSRPKK